MDAYIQAMFGMNAVQVPINMIVQRVSGDNKVAGVFQSGHPVSHKLLYGCQDPHALLLGDMVFRPRLVVGTSHMVGQGISHIYRTGFEVDNWDFDNTNILINQNALPIETQQQ